MARSLLNYIQIFNITQQRNESFEMRRRLFELEFSVRFENSKLVCSSIYFLVLEPLGARDCNALRYPQTFEKHFVFIRSSPLFEGLEM